MNVFDNALRVLNTADPTQKMLTARQTRKDWQHEKSINSPSEPLPAHPARPEAPPLVALSDVPRRRLGSEAGRAALLHAVAHIEFNAIDLAADMICRFGQHTLIEDCKREDFIDDWVSVLDDEARHFGLINERLKGMNFAYGDLPAHNGLWEAAHATSENFAARLAVAPMVLEARGLDVTLQMIEKLRRNEDHESADIFKIIYDDEIGHVAVGSKWFHYVARKENKEPQSHFKKLVNIYFKGKLKPPFNHIARNQAGMPVNYYT